MEDGKHCRRVHVELGLKLGDGDKKLARHHVIDCNRRTWLELQERSHVPSRSPRPCIDKARGLDRCRSMPLGLFTGPVYHCLTILEGGIVAMAAEWIKAAGRHEAAHCWMANGTMPAGPGRIPACDIRLSSPLPCMFRILFALPAAEMRCRDGLRETMRR